jgi:hypothetical protein
MGIPEGKKLYSYFNNIRVRIFILKRAEIFRVLFKFAEAAGEARKLPADRIPAAASLNELAAGLFSESAAASSRCAPCGVHRRIAGSRVIESLIVGFQLGYGAMLPFIGLRQEGAAMKRPEGRGLTAQRRDGAVSANVFQDGQAAHVRISPFFPGHELAAERFSIR